MQHQAITVQPGAPGFQWMMLPQTIPGCPPGLEYLAAIDRILCFQKVHLLEAIIGWEQNNKYTITNANCEQVYYAFEETNWCERLCCGKQRSYTIHIVNNLNQEVMRLNRPLKCCAGTPCCAAIDCCSHESTVEAPVGNVIGYIRQTSACCAFNFDIEDVGGRPVLEIQGPCCACRCCSDVRFPIFTKRDSSSGTQVEIGSVTKKWTGFVKEAFTDADNFAVTFPLDLDVKMKAVLIGALFLIDFIAFEQSGNQGSLLNAIAS